MFKKMMLLLVIGVTLFAQNTDKSSTGLSEREIFINVFESTLEAMRMKPVSGVEGSVMVDTMDAGDSTAVVLLPGGSVLKSVAVDSLSSGTTVMSFFMVSGGSEYAVTDPELGTAYTVTLNSVPGVYPLKPSLFQGITGDSIRVKVNAAQTQKKAVLFRVGGY